MMRRRKAMQMARLALYVAFLLIYSHASAAPPEGASCCSIADRPQIEYRAASVRENGERDALYSSSAPAPGFMPSACR
jgi:hypothetical protein